ncbi:magnesium and cobalt transporter [Meinhardsimonia xiamenensis]|jgi:magnesium and cobalt transporter|uniref:Magnesium and cobalt transporter n=1 Tax=Meinhardsimonia xiamenensis TaxID=990712 RepID=A0A1G9CE18_9RHOB|nr:hemolysin family protein [Meinhardsimonia xiamenensis]PRX38394.1 magnesium and cobalt transporter [Meinhardsimonia xiamenensis]SDK49882.1 magnesium and cobalt transporter [Meinhardsimonia xiamenensis]
MANAEAGQSSAAQGARITRDQGKSGLPLQTDEEPQSSGGIIARLFRKLGGGSAPAAARDAGRASRANGASAHGLANLGRLRVADVAVPKAEIVAVPIDISRDQLLEVFRKSGYSRLPVYRGTLDHPVGLVHLKDVALEHGFGKEGKRFSLRKLLRPLIFVPPSMPIGVLLQKMQNDRIHMALVIDEYGGVDGLVTIEDLIEQVIGEIEDEHDVNGDSYWVQEKPGCYLVQARAPLDEFEEEIGIPLRVSEEEEDVDTVGGLVFLLVGRVPARGEVIRHPAGPEFEVVDADPRRVKRLRVRLPQALAKAGEASAVSARQARSDG